MSICFFIRNQNKIKNLLGSIKKNCIYKYICSNNGESLYKIYICT